MTFSITVFCFKLDGKKLTLFTTPAKQIITMAKPVGITRSIKSTSANYEMHCLHLEIQTKKQIEVVLTPRQDELDNRIMGMVRCEELDAQYNSATNFPTPLVRDIRYILRDIFTDLWNSPKEFEASWTILESMMCDFYYNESD